MADQHVTQPNDDLTEMCLTTHKFCLQAARHGLDAGGDLAHPDVINILLDCAESNAMVASFLSRGSARTRHVVDLNARIASACADVLLAFEHGGGPMRSAYAMCLEVADLSGHFGEASDGGAEVGRDQALADSFPASDPPASGK